GNAGAVPPVQYMRVEVLDGSTTLNTNSIQVKLDGTALTTHITQPANITTIAAQTPILGAGTAHTNTLIYADSGGMSYTNFWSFTVGNYQTIPAEYALA